MNADVIIVGAGILGLTLARRLAAGGCSSLVLEKEAAAGIHASGKNAGMFRQLYRNPQLSDWAARSRKLWPERVFETCFRETGSYVAGRTCPAHSPGLFEQRKIKTAQGSSVDAVFCASDGLIDSREFISLLAADVHKKVSRIEFNERTLSAHWNSGTWSVETAKARFESAYLVMAGGAWASQLPIIAASRDINPASGLLQPFARYLFLVEGWPRGFMPEPGCGFYWNEPEEWYLREWDEHSRLFSLCDQLAADPDSFSGAETPLKVLEAALSSAFPEFAPDLNLRRSWHCFRTYTPDQLPIWGPDPHQDGLFWLAGFGGYGMSTGYAAAHDLAELLLKGNCAVGPDMLISRFGKPGSFRLRGFPA